MPTESEQIAALTRMLKQAQAKNDKLKEQLEKKNKQVADLKKRNKELADIAVIAGLLHGPYSELLQVVSDYLTSNPDLSEKDKAVWDAVVARNADHLTNLTKNRWIRRFLVKGSECLNTLGAKKAATAYRSARNKGDQSIKRRADRQQTVFGTVTKAYAGTANPSNDASVAAGQKIATAPCPEVKECAAGVSPGRQAVQKTGQAPIKEVETLMDRCPVCGGTDIEYSREYVSKLRTCQASIGNLIRHMQVQYRFARCCSCGHTEAQWASDSERPVSPNGTIGQSTAVSAGVLMAEGVALNKTKNVILGSKPEDQLGNETLEKNVHRWANDYGRLLADAVRSTLVEQYAIELDETPIRVLQVEGLGICEAPKAEDLNTADYVMVMSSTKNAEQPCVTYRHLGGRSADKIRPALADVKSKVWITDAYAAYDSILKNDPKYAEVKHQSCLVHARRMYIDALNIPSIVKLIESKKQVDAVEKVKASLDNPITKSDADVYAVCMVLVGLQKIYITERSLNRLEDESEEAHLRRIADTRTIYSLPIMDSIDEIVFDLAEKGHARLEKGRYVSGKADSMLDAAIVYWLNHRESLRVFLTDPKVDPDSNLVEQGARPVCCVRKAINHKQSIEYAESLCTWLTLTETASRNGIKDPIGWLVSFGTALHDYRSRRSMETEITEQGKKLDSKQMVFLPGSEDGFDITPWLPWNYVKTEAMMDAVVEAID